LIIMVLTVRNKYVSDVWQVKASRRLSVLNVFIVSSRHRAQVLGFSGHCNTSAITKIDCSPARTVMRLASTHASALMPMPAIRQFAR
jgi:hypothetical protein